MAPEQLTCSRILGSTTLHSDSFSSTGRAKSPVEGSEHPWVHGRSARWKIVTGTLMNSPTDESCSERGLQRGQAGLGLNRFRNARPARRVTQSAEPS